MERRLLISMAAGLLLISISACSTRVAAQPDVAVFIDVPEEEIWGQAIAHVRTEGYMMGKSAEVFDPGAPITRAEIAVVMLRVNHGTDYSPDQVEGDWWTAWVEQAEDEGFLQEGSDPSAPATRADIATLIWLLEK